MDKQLPIMSDPVIEEYMNLLLSNNQKRDYDNTAELLKYIESMEKQFEMVTKELGDIKKQLNAMQNPTMKVRVASAVEKTQNTVNAGMDKLNDLKNKIVSSMKENMDSFKQKGINGVVKTINFLHIHKTLHGLQKSFAIAMKRTQSMSLTVNAVSMEVHRAKRSIRNVGLLLAGRQPVHQVNDKARLNIMQKSSQGLFRLFQNMAMKTSKIINRLENLEKKSVKTELKLITSSKDVKKSYKEKNREQLR